MKYKLVTLPRGTAKLPVLDLGYSSINLKQGAQLAITPQTLNYLGNTQTFESAGYSATIGDVRLFSQFQGQGINTVAAQNANTTSTQTIGTNVSTTVTGTQINLTATTVNTLFGTQSQLRTTLTVVGLDSGARLTIPVTITQNQLT
jgi:Lhr-like helicase